MLSSFYAMHDAYGRFYNKYEWGLGYCYVLNKEKTPKILKLSPIL